MYIRPTIGRMLWYRPLEWEEGEENTPPKTGDPSDGFMSAQVVSVEHAGSGGTGPLLDYAVVNLSVTDRYGQRKARNNIILRHDITPGEDVCPPGCAVWMPFQKGQAAAQVREPSQDEVDKATYTGTEPAAGTEQGGDDSDAHPPSQEGNEPPVA